MSVLTKIYHFDTDPLGTPIDVYICRSDTDEFTSLAAPEPTQQESIDFIVDCEQKKMLIWHPADKTGRPAICRQILTGQYDSNVIWALGPSAGSQPVADPEPVDTVVTEKIEEQCYGCGKMKDKGQACWWCGFGGN
jgi:hypothetical protein